MKNHGIIMDSCLFTCIMIKYIMIKYIIKSLKDILIFIIRGYKSLILTSSVEKIDFK